MSQSLADLGFEQLVRRYAHLIRSVATRVAGGEAATLAEDVEQRVMLALWQQISREQEIRHPASYIYRAAVRETVRALRKERRRGEIDAAAVETFSEGGKDPEELLELREMGNRIQAIIAELPPERRRAVQAHLAGFAVREIMQMYDWSYNRARNLIGRGVRDLRRRLEAGGIGA